MRVYKVEVNMKIRFGDESDEDFLVIQSECRILKKHSWIRIFDPHMNNLYKCRVCMKTIGGIDLGHNR